MSTPPKFTDFFLSTYADTLFEILSPIERIPGRVSHEMGNFFKCDLSRTLHEGSSGSPILLDDKVIGILCGNFPEDPENRILYMKASAITHLLE